MTTTILPSYQMIFSNLGLLWPYAIFFTVIFASARFGTPLVALIAIFAATTIFVGFRFETGFDWPVYKRIYSAISSNPTFDQMKSCQELFGQEPAFIGLLGLFAFTGVDYEIPQAVFFVLFLSSIVIFARVIEVNASIPIVVSMCFLLPSLGFSTVRQCLAVSFFMFSIAALLRRKFLTTGILFALAMMSQISSTIYVIAALIAALARKHNRLIASPFVFIGSSLFLFCATHLILSMTDQFYDLLPDKIVYYLRSPHTGKISPWMAVMISMQVIIGLHVISSRALDNEKSQFLARLIIILAIFGIGSSPFTIASERAFYLLATLYPLYLSSAVTAYRRVAISIACCAGLTLSFLTIGRYPVSLVFFPYQNYLQPIATGKAVPSNDRSKALLEEVERVVPSIAEIRKPHETSGDVKTPKKALVCG